MNRAEAIIDLAAITANVRAIQGRTNSSLLAVVKADAYGHGLVPVAERALASGVNWLGTALLEEALTLRAAGIKAPIIAWLTPTSDDFAVALKNRIDLAIPSLAHLEVVANAARESSEVARVHLEVDSGMSRGGALGEWQELIDRAAQAEEQGAIKVMGIWSHFARADEPEHSFNAEQLRTFEVRLSQARESGLNPEIVHLSNSAATLGKEAAHFDLVRVGIALYGLTPDVNNLGSSQSLGLRPVMSLRARLHLVKSVPAGSQVGYGGTATTKSETKLGVVAMGYADGVPRNADGSVGVLVGNKCAPIIGRVSMDQFVVDLGNNSVARAGDWAYLISDPATGGYTADAWAKACGTINYEIVTRIGPRVPRIFIN